MSHHHEVWHIKPKSSWLQYSLRDIFQYRDLLVQLVRKDFLLYYQQTLLGPLWMMINPVLSVFVYMLVFNRLMGISTEGVPPFAFYLVGTTLWTFFSDIFSGTSNTFVQNIHIFNKVYFPRIIMPLSTTLLHCLRFCINLLIMLGILSFYYFNGKISFSPLQTTLFLIPIILTAMQALGLGLIFSVITTKYRDLSNLLSVLIRLLMFVCPVFYSVASIQGNLKWYLHLNPLTSLFEMFRFSFVGKGSFTPYDLVYSTVASFIILFSGILLFNKIGNRLIDIA